MNYPQPGYGHPGYPQPPRKSGMGCLSIGLIVGGILMVCFVVLIAVVGRTTPADRKKIDDELARQAAEAEKAKEERRAALRKECKLKPDALVFTLADDEVKDLCRAEVIGMLKVPSSADFPNRATEGGFVTEDGCTRIYSSYVEAKNAFGVPVKTPFKCTWSPKTNAIAAKL